MLDALIIGSYYQYGEAVARQDRMAAVNPERTYEVVEFDGVWELIEHTSQSAFGTEAEEELIMTDEQRGYVAGLIVGEAHISPYTLHRMRRGDKIYYERYPELRIYNRDRDVVESVQKIVGGLILKYTHEPITIRIDKAIWRLKGGPMFALKLRYGRAFDVLKQTKHLLTGTKIFRRKRWRTRDLAQMVIEDPHYSMKKKPRWAITREMYEKLRRGQ